MDSHAVEAFLDDAYDKYAVKQDGPGSVSPTLYYVVPAWAIDKLAEAVGYWQPVQLSDFDNDPDLRLRLKP